MAQDFRSAFGLGEDDKTISTVDAAGVAMAAIKSLFEIVKEKDLEISELKGQVRALKHEVAEQGKWIEGWETRLATLEKTAKKSEHLASSEEQSASADTVLVRYVR